MRIGSRVQQVGLTCHKPHGFGHGHAVYCIQMTKDICDLKAISMNLMHKNLQVTDRIYRILLELDVKTRMTQLGSQVSNDNQQSIERLEKFLGELKARKP